jgi:hypothetical protein
VRVSPASTRRPRSPALIVRAVLAMRSNGLRLRRRISQAPAASTTSRVAEADASISTRRCSDRSTSVVGVATTTVAPPSSLLTTARHRVDPDVDPTVKGRPPPLRSAGRSGVTSLSPRVSVVGSPVRGRSWAYVPRGSTAGGPPGGALPAPGPRSSPVSSNSSRVASGTDDRSWSSSWSYCERA